VNYPEKSGEFTKTSPGHATLFTEVTSRFF